MGKRRKSVSDYDYIAKKVKKLEKKLSRVRRSDRNNSTSSSSESSSTGSSSDSESRVRHDAATTVYPEPLCIEGVASTSTGAAAAYTVPPVVDSVPIIPSMSAEDTGADPLPTTDEQAAGTSTGSQIDGELLLMLGDDPSQKKNFSKEILPDLAVRLEYFATNGLSKEDRKGLLDKYLLPANCTLIGAPILNPETESAVPDTVQKRDKGIETRQKQRAAVTSCLGEALTLLMTSEPKNPTITQLVWDATRLLCDSQATDSAIRRSFILNSLRKDLKDRLQTTNIDKLLFGEGLADTIKAAKAISKSGAEIRPVSVKQPAAAKHKRLPQDLNWRAPAPHRRARGNNRSREPASHNSQRNRPANSSKQSSRPVKNYPRNQH